jgi:hypothetical protein
MKVLVMGLLGMGLTLASATSIGQTATAEEIAELQAQVAALTARLNALENETGSIPAPPPIEHVAPPAVAGHWTDTVEWGGDLRYRHEAIDDAAEVYRASHRLRARVNVAADIADNVRAGFGLSTGGITNDSGNQTLTDGFSYKDINVDLAYLDWSVTDELDLIAGKMVNPFFRPGGYHLIYDGDIRPEGLALKYRSGEFFSGVSAFWVEERSAGPDSMLVGLQGGYRGVLGNGATLTVGASYYDTSHAQGRAPFFTPFSGQGNQLDANGNYLYGFSELELFGQLELDVAGAPLIVFADVVRNRDAADFDQGYAIGAEWGNASAPGDWSVGYVYEDLEANAVIGAFTDSDFAGGTSDGRGHSLLASYVFPGGLNFGLRYIIGERGEAAGELRDYNRLQADISARY